MKRILNQARKMLNASKKSSNNDIYDIANDVIDEMNCHAMDIEKFDIVSEGDEAYTVSFDFLEDFENDYCMLLEVARTSAQCKGYILSTMRISKNKMSFSFRKFTQDDYKRLEFAYNNNNQMLDCELSKYIEFYWGAPFDGIFFIMHDNKKYCVNICGNFVSKKKFKELASIIGKESINQFEFCREENVNDYIEFVV